MKQNVYDEPEFFGRYSAMPRSIGGLGAAGEWQALRSLLPDFRDKRVLDLGCGFGWHSRYAREQHARSVIGIDLSEKMLARAQALTDDPAIRYQKAAIEDVEFAAGAFDIVLSSLVLHYVERFDLVCPRIHRWLVPGGAFVLSVEHPVFTAREAQDWYYDGQNHERLHWPVDRYQEEGIRHTSWMADDVVKYHRTVSTYLNTLIDSGFRISRILEPRPTQEMLDRSADMKDELRRPMFLLMSAVAEEAARP